MSMMSRLSLFPKGPSKTQTSSRRNSSHMNAIGTEPDREDGAETSGLATPPRSTDTTPETAPALVMPSMAFESSPHNNLALLSNPTPPRTPPPPPAAPYAWLWRCHICHIVYPLGCTRRCLECSHEMCSTSGDSPSSSPPRNGRRSSRKRRAGGPCRAEFDYANWAAWGTWKRSLLDPAFASAARRDSSGSGDRDGDAGAGAAVGVAVGGGVVEREMKEGMFVGRTHNCALHCDYPSECHHVRFAVLTERRQAEAARAKEKLAAAAASASSSAVATFKRSFVEYDQHVGAGAAGRARARTNAKNKPAFDDDSDDDDNAEEDDDDDDDDVSGRNPLEEFILSPVAVDDDDDIDHDAGVGGVLGPKRSDHSRRLLLLATTAAAAAAEAAEAAANARSAEAKLADSKRAVATAPVSPSAAFPALQIGPTALARSSSSPNLGYAGPAGTLSHTLARRNSRNDAEKGGDDDPADLGNPANLADRADPHEDEDEGHGGLALQRYGQPRHARDERQRRSMARVAQITGLDSFGPLGGVSSSSSSPGLGLGLDLGLVPSGLAGSVVDDLDERPWAIGLGISHSAAPSTDSTTPSPSSVYSVQSLSAGPFSFTSQSSPSSSPSQEAEATAVAVASRPRSDSAGHADRLLSSLVSSSPALLTRARQAIGAGLVTPVVGAAEEDSEMTVVDDENATPTAAESPSRQASRGQDGTTGNGSSTRSSPSSVMGWWADQRRQRRKNRWSRRVRAATPSPKTPMLSSPSSPTPTPESDDWDSWNSDGDSASPFTSPESDGGSPDTNPDTHVKGVLPPPTQALVKNAAVGAGLGLALGPTALAKKHAAGDSLAVQIAGDDDGPLASTTDRDLIDLLRIRNAFMRGDI